MAITMTGLNNAERAVVEWQYIPMGDFKTALWNAITHADPFNLERLAAGFPAEVEGYRHYAYITGWWPSVQKKAGIVTDGPEG